MSALQDLLRDHVGRGRPISMEQLAREANAKERTAYKWLDDELDSEPTIDNLRNILSSTILAADFRAALAGYLFHRCTDLRVVAVPATGAAPHAHPLRITFDHAATLAELQRAVERALCELGDGGAAVTEAEHAEIDRLAGEIDRLTAELRRSVRAKLAKQRTA